MVRTREMPVILRGAIETDLGDLDQLAAGAPEHAAKNVAVAFLPAPHRLQRRFALHTNADLVGVGALAWATTQLCQWGAHGQADQQERPATVSLHEGDVVGAPVPAGILAPLHPKAGRSKHLQRQGFRWKDRDAVRIE